MRLGVYTVRDTKVGFQTPYFDVTDDTAKRGFSFAVHQDNSVIGFAPKDYDLYRSGYFDTDTGKIETEDFPVLIMSGVDAYA